MGLDIGFDIFLWMVASFGEGERNRGRGVMVDLRTYLIRPASRSMMLRSAPTASARSVCV